MLKNSGLLPGITLQPHQQHVLNEDKKPRKVFLYHGLGSGKSLTGLGLAEQLGEPYTAIVPASLRNNIHKEQDKWTDRQVPSNVVSYSALAAGKPIDNPNSLIFDEAQRLRNANSKTTTRAIDLARKAKQVALLSGTPIVNHPSELSVPISMLTDKNITPEEFTNRYVGTKKVYPGLFGRLRGVTPVEEPTIHHEAELRALLKGHVDYYKPKQSTVPVTHVDVPVEMSADQTALYRSAFARMPWMLRWKLQHKFSMTPEELRRSVAFLTGPRQFGISTYTATDRTDPLKAFDTSPKLQAAYSNLQKVLTDPRKKALIFSNFIDAGLIPYSAGLTRAGIPHGIFHGGLSDVQRRQLVDDYNSGKLRALLLGPSGAEGISLNSSSLIQQLDEHYNAVRSQQAVARGLRFDAHIGLPEDLKNVAVERYISKLPLGVLDRGMQSLGFDKSDKQRATDDYLIAMGARKDKLNDKFLNLLKSVGEQRV